jgi:hypothetical protein
MEVNYHGKRFITLTPGVSEGNGKESTINRALGGSTYPG